MAHSGNKPIAILTDFGYDDHYVGVMKGVIASLAPGAPIVDITHGIPPHSIAAGALALKQSWRYFPRATIFVAVVDPGVGTQRLPIAVETRSGARLVGPDNGLLAPAAEEAGLKRAVELRSPRYRLKEVSATFHGRDIFAPAAAWLWRGARLDAFGPTISRIEPLKLEEPACHGLKLHGTIVYVDRFGNLVSNIDRRTLAAFEASFPGQRLWVRLKRSPPIELMKTYGDAAKGTPLAIFGSFELLEIALREKSAAERFGAREGSPIVVSAGR